MKLNFDASHADGQQRLPCKIYFSCPQFTVLLSLEGPLIVKAAPIVRAFEGQSLDALKAWARTRFGGPIIIETLN